jgi:hypothetical protein
MHIVRLCFQASLQTVFYNLFFLARLTERGKGDLNPEDVWWKRWAATGPPLVSSVRKCLCLPAGK